jgi:hypothetical protein
MVASMTAFHRLARFGRIVKERALSIWPSAVRASAAMAAARG